MVHSRKPKSWGKLTVHKEGYHRKGYTRKSGIKVSPTEVSPTTFKIRDVGSRGRGEKVLPTLKKGTLGGKGFFSRTTEARRKHEKELTKKLGEKKVASKLRAIGVLQKRVNPTVSEKAFGDARYISGSFKNKKYVGYPEGFGRNK